MLTITTDYIEYTSGHRRHHAGSQIKLIPTAYDAASAGDSHAAIAFLSLPDIAGNNLPFAFMSVTGSAQGNLLFTDVGTQNIPVGDSDIKILIVYAPPGGGLPGGAPGVWVDAFNVDLGDFSDSDFMQVYTNGMLDNAKTLTANNDGVVVSDSEEDMISIPNVDGVPFFEWKKMGEKDVVKTKDYDLKEGESGIVFAFYQTFNKQPQPPLHNYEALVYISSSVKIDAGGTGRDALGHIHHIGPMGELTAKLLTTVAILSVAENMSSTIKEQAVNLACNHLVDLAGSIKETGI